MRRFELIEGKSAKFWQVEVDGSDLNLRWGRLGTSGQSQTKSFASDAAAAKEADKLIKEKTKKGYSEVEADESAPAPKKARPAEEPKATPAKVDPAPAPSPQPAPVATSFEPRVREDALASHLATWHRGSGDAATELAKLRADSKQVRSNFAKLDRAPASDRERTRATLEVLTGTAEPRLDVDGAARLLALAQWLAPPYLASCFSDADLARIALAAGNYSLSYRTVGNDYVSVLSEGFVDMSLHLDHCLAAAVIADALPAAERAAIVAEVDAAWSSWPLSQRTRAAIVLGSDARWPERVLESAPGLPRTTLTMVASLRSMEQLERLLAGLDTQGWFFLPASVLALLIRRIGTAAIPLLLRLAGSVQETHPIATIMPAIESIEIARYMGELLDHRELKSIARPYLEAVPVLAMAALATSRKQMARSFVEATVRANVTMLDELLPKLGPDERAALEQIKDAAVVSVPEASASELPRVLVEPPWTRPKKKAGKPVTLELTPLEMPEAIEWREGQRALWGALESWGKPSASGSAQLKTSLDKWVDGGDGQVASWERGVNIHLFSQAEDDVALECWNRMTPAAFGWTYADTVRRLVVRFEERGVPGYVAYAGKNASTAAELFARVRSQRLAPFYARVLASRGKARAYAQAWMESFSEEAAAGLIPDALGKDKKARAVAEDAISYLGQKGRRDVVLSVAERYGKETIAPVTELLERDPLDAVPTKLPKLPEWAKADALPRPLLMGRAKALPASAVENLLTMLAFSPLDPAYPGIEHVRKACDPVSLVDFSWALCSTWLGADGSSAGDFAMLSLAHLAGDEGARRLTPLIRKWPGEGGHARAVKGLDVLAAIGTDVALMHLHGISQKLKFKGLQAKAQEKIALVAEARELTTEELADRLVPDLDLDEDGTMILDFGARQFTVGFDEHLAPFVLENGARKKDLPKPGKSDDAEKAKAAVDAYKTLKKDVRAIASHQITRLEQLMCSERRVSLDVFRKFFVGHPLVIHLARRLVWGAYVDGAFAHAFRIDDERRATSADDEPIELADAAEIGLLHPLATSDEDKARFGELFADYELLQPFEQLGRAVYAATSDELAQKKLARFEHAVAPLGGVRGLESRGWVRGMPQDAGIIWDVTKPIPGHPDLVIVVTLDPGFSAAGYNDFADTANQKLGAPVLRKKGQWQGAEDLSALGAVQMSELIRDLTLITSG